MNSVQSEDFQFHILKELRQLRTELSEIKQTLGKEENIELIETPIRTSIEHRITNFLRELEIPAHIKGYRFVRDAIRLVYQNTIQFSFVTKELYPELAKLHQTTPSRVERAIRHAIEISASKGNRRKPTNSEFIFSLVDKLKLEDGGYED